MEAQRADFGQHEEPLMNTPFIIKELEDALTMLKLKKDSGPDKITNEVLLLGFARGGELPVKLGLFAREAKVMRVDLVHGKRLDQNAHVRNTYTFHKPFNRLKTSARGAAVGEWQ
nr:hypothetical protein BaRGS_002707 [Batillaria attramentaria]